tara:strand:+ start:562 stop:1287 length:726 start_codon:yes stop_codon:yes gene_type:complete
MTNLKHLCFDKDGVLIDVHRYWRHTTEIRTHYLTKRFKLSGEQKNRLISAMGINLSSGKIKKKGPIGYEPRVAIIDKVISQLLTYSIKVTALEIDVFFKEIDLYQQKNNDYDVKLLEGVLEFLEEKKNKYIMTIFTSDRATNAKMTLEKLGIAKFFTEILGGDSINFPKPNPEGILQACFKVDKKVNQTAYISDTSSDLIMANDANVLKKIGVLSGLGTKKELTKTGDYVFENFFELGLSL